MLKRPVKEKGTPPPPLTWGSKPNFPHKTLRFIKQSPLYIKVWVFRMRFNLNKILLVMPELK